MFPNPALLQTAVRGSVPGLAEKYTINLCLSVPIIVNPCHVADVLMLIEAVDTSKV